MNVIIRLYRTHDLDLIALNNHPDIDLARTMKRAVMAYAREEWDYFIPLPRRVPFSVDLNDCAIHFALVPGQDDDVIEFLNSFRYGFRNAALKNIFRYFLEMPYMDPLTDDDSSGIHIESETRSPSRAKRGKRTASGRKRKKASVEQGKSIPSKTPVRSERTVNEPSPEPVRQKEPEPLPETPAAVTARMPEPEIQTIPETEPEIHTKDTTEVSVRNTEESVHQAYVEEPPQVQDYPDPVAEETETDEDDDFNLFEAIDNMLNK